MAQSSSRSAGAAFLRIGTRGSPLALTQARQVAARLAAAHGCAPEDIALVVIRTSGDAIQDRVLAEVGGKGLFTKEIEEALLAGVVDVAVHSAKDMATVLPEGLTIAACLARADARDAFVCRTASRLADLPAGAVIGTASLRREALVRRLRPDLVVKPLRGNVETRLRRVEDGTLDATVLALAGLTRLGLAAAAVEVLPLDSFPPAIGQGIIALETRTADAATRARLAAIADAPALAALTAERSFLRMLDGSCRSPIAGHATVSPEELRLHGLLLSTDGREAVEVVRSGAPAQAEALGADAGLELRKRAPPRLIAG